MKGQIQCGTLFLVMCLSEETAAWIKENSAHMSNIIVKSFGHLPFMTESFMNNTELYYSRGLAIMLKSLLCDQKSK